MESLGKTKMIKYSVMFLVTVGYHQYRVLDHSLALHLSYLTSLIGRSSVFRFVAYYKGASHWNTTALCLNKTQQRNDTFSLAAIPEIITYRDKSPPPLYSQSHVSRDISSYRFQSLCQASAAQQYLTTFPSSKPDSSGHTKSWSFAHFVHATPC